MVWTRFMDMHSGGGQKLDWSHIYIEAPQKEAEVIFQNRFGRNPNRVTCTCCGEDYSISEEEDLEQATAHERQCSYSYFTKEHIMVPRDAVFERGKGCINGAYGKYVEVSGSTSLEDYEKQANVLVIHADEIEPSQRIGSLEPEGYVWHERGD